MLWKIGHSLDMKTLNLCIIQFSKDLQFLLHWFGHKNHHLLKDYIFLYITKKDVHANVFSKQEGSHIFFYQNPKI